MSGGASKLHPGVPTKLIGAVCGLCAFAIAVVAGLAADNPADTIILRAIAALVVGQIVGLVAGGIAERTVNDAVVSYRASRPFPGARARTPGAHVTPGGDGGEPARGSHGPPASAGSPGAQVPT